MKKINDDLFKKHELELREKFSFKGGAQQDHETYSLCEHTESTWYFWEDDCQFPLRDITSDPYDVLPAANHISTR